MGVLPPKCGPKAGLSIFGPIPWVRPAVSMGIVTWPRAFHLELRGRCIAGGRSSGRRRRQPKLAPGRILARQPGKMPSPKTVYISRSTKSQVARPVKIGSPQSALHFRKFQQPESPEPRAARGAQGALRKVSGLALPTRLRRAGPRACPPTFSSGTLLRTPRAALIHRGPNLWY